MNNFSDKLTDIAIYIFALPIELTQNSPKPIRILARILQIFWGLIGVFLAFPFIALAVIIMYFEDV
jgi:hypothetical protein